MKLKEISELERGTSIMVKGIETPVTYLGIISVVDFGEFSSTEEALSSISSSKPKSRCKEVQYRYDNKLCYCKPSEVLGEV